MEYRIMIETGDPGGDGHMQYERWYFDTNYPIEKLDEAYSKSVELTGVDMHNECSEYEEREFSKEAIEALDKFKVLDTSSGMSPRKFVDMVMKFVALSMPDDFEYERVGNNEIPCLGEFAYGLYY